MTTETRAAAWRSRMTGSDEDVGASAGRNAVARTPPALDIPRRELVTLLAYLATGSHKAAAHRLGISESTSRQRVSLLLGRVGARNAAQAVWALRDELEAEAQASPWTSVRYPNTRSGRSLEGGAGGPTLR